MTSILGVDFSGAKDAGRRIWVAKGKAAPSGAFQLESCLAATDLENGGRDTSTAVSALTSMIVSDANTIVGCDFPFSLPRQLITNRTWDGFVQQFPKRYSDPQAFRTILRLECNGTEYKRQTDRDAGTPFNSYNLRLYRQTWWGIARVLGPLVNAGRAVVRPQQPVKKNVPTIVEVCAACTLKHRKVYKRFGAYKGKGLKPRQQRKKIVDYLVNERLLTFAGRLETELRQILLDNAGGDALDAVIGAIAAAHADLNAEPDAHQRLEGRVYFEIAG